jgi:hypothetical protein
MVIAPNTILFPALTTRLIDTPHRVLMVDEVKHMIWMISLRRLSKTGAKRPYMTRPVAVDLSLLEVELAAGSIKTGQFEQPSHWLLSDADCLASAPTQKERGQRESRQKRRDSAWASIAPLVKNLSTAELIRKLPRASTMIAKRAKDHGVNASTLYSRIHLYLANGSILNGLLPATDRCGGPGQEREQIVHIGPKRKDFQDGLVDSPGYVLSAQDKERLARGYALISSTRSKMDAFLLVSEAFWADSRVESNGVVIRDLWEVHRRPTFAQFDDWGARRSGARDRRRWFGFSVPEEEVTHHGGSSQDLVAAVGQYSMLDATSTDVYLTSMYSRLRKLPPMTRTVIREVRSKVYLGFYVGWEKPSPRTALLAILCGAQDKAEVCAKYGIQIASDQWPGMLCRTNLIDNGEMRAEEATEAERQIGFNIEFAKTYDGASKGDVESQHNADHKMFDHKVPGSNRGKRHVRGMPHAIDDALWNHYEYMQGLLRHMIDSNNIEEPEIAPTDMKIAGIPPTRINIFKWLRDHGQAADLTCDIAHLRALTLPSWPAVMQHNGIVLKSPDGKRNLAELRFYSDALKNDHRYDQARRNRVCVPIDVRCDGNNLEGIWFASSGLMLHIPNVLSDRKLMREGTVPDLLDHMAAEGDRLRGAQGEQQQAALGRLTERELTTDAAQAQARAEAGQSGKPSKKKQRENLRENTTKEMLGLNPSLQSVLATGEQQARADKPEMPNRNAAETAAQTAVASFLASISSGSGQP